MTRTLWIFCLLAVFLTIVAIAVLIGYSGRVSIITAQRSQCIVRSAGTAANVNNLRSDIATLQADILVLESQRPNPLIDNSIDQKKIDIAAKQREIFVADRLVDPSATHFLQYRQDRRAAEASGFSCDGVYPSPTLF